MNSRLAPIEPIQLGDRTTELLRAAIIGGDLPPGSILRDRELAEDLGVSRTPVREALHRLEGVGLVVSRGRSGWAVSDFTEQDVRELFQLRQLMEPAGIEALAAAPDEAVEHLAHFFHDYPQAVPQERYADYFAEDNAFHKSIVACSPNRRLNDMYSVIESHIDRGRHFLITAAAGRADETLDEHRAIASAIASRDFERARVELLAHLRTGEQLMIEQIRARRDAEADAPNAVRRDN
ncbi:MULTISPECIES: GntR family transcriptional regulator [unclassified Nocardioides]|uniref:GntR family transcriptional regulator n=1 Tax=unclassified Nocardioides TaxID=2615069 RepID=UPI0009EFCEDF|nr:MULTISPECIES: GntR family transcriptional regulator [unclassified Nocardioides]GAW51832.1 Transcriptional regulator GntR family [Nocardioides sp. PD653-B2]GAW53514.1 Transcriptional regulator GntR family [Nocardioides sp. PD653]